MFENFIFCVSHDEAKWARVCFWQAFMDKSSKARAYPSAPYVGRLLVLPINLDSAGKARLVKKEGTKKKC